MLDNKQTRRRKIMTNKIDQIKKQIKKAVEQTRFRMALITGQ